MRAASGAGLWTRRMVAAIAMVLGMGLGTTAHAQGTTFADLWWIPAESGWGVTIDQQGDTLFLTFFIQKSDGAPYWVTAILTRTTPGTTITIPVTFTGDVYETKGTFYGQTWVPGNVSNRKVGTATFTANSLLSASLSYSIDGTNVQKTIQRQTLKLLSFTGRYLGGVYFVTSNCNPASLNNSVSDDAGPITVTQNGSSFNLKFQGPESGCEFNGTYSQNGQLGRVSGGTLACSTGITGSFTMPAVQWTLFGMTAGLTGQLSLAGQTCDITGAVGGVTIDHFGP